MFSYRLQIEFVSGILIFVSIEGAPGPEGFLTLRPRLAELAPEEALLSVCRLIEKFKHRDT